MTPEARVPVSGRSAVREIPSSEGFEGRSPRRPNYPWITGRTEQFNVGIRADTKGAIQEIADENGWGLRETVQRLVEVYRAPEG